MPLHLVGLWEAVTRGVHEAAMGKSSAWTQADPAPWVRPVQPWWSGSNKIRGQIRWGKTGPSAGAASDGWAGGLAACGVWSRGFRYRLSFEGFSDLELQRSREPIPFYRQGN